LALLAGLAGALMSWETTVAAQAADGNDATAALSTVKDICLPLLKGASVAAVAKTTGLKGGRDDWFLPVSGKRRIEISPPGGANPHVCEATIIHDPTAGDAIVSALGAWAAMQAPALQQLKQQEKVTGALYQLTTSSWEGRTADGNLAVVYSENKTLQGKPVAGGLDQATLSVSLTPAPAAPS
jgi:hypothetical protein